MSIRKLGSLSRSITNLLNLVYLIPFFIDQSFSIDQSDENNNSSNMTREKKGISKNQISSKSIDKLGLSTATTTERLIISDSNTESYFEDEYLKIIKIFQDSKNQNFRKTYP